MRARRVGLILSAPLTAMIMVMTVAPSATADAYDERMTETGRITLAFFDVFQSGVPWAPWDETQGTWFLSQGATSALIHR